MKNTSAYMGGRAGKGVGGRGCRIKPHKIR